jgi:hypothetical protein
VPAAAVIPAPIAYIQVVAVKKLVVGCLIESSGPGALVVLCVVGMHSVTFFSRKPVFPSLEWAR